MSAFSPHDRTLCSARLTWCSRRNISWLTKLQRQNNRKMFKLTKLSRQANLIWNAQNLRKKKLASSPARLPSIQSTMKKFRFGLPIMFWRATALAQSWPCPRMISGTLNLLSKKFNLAQSVRLCRPQTIKRITAVLKCRQLYTEVRSERPNMDTLYEQV